MRDMNLPQQINLKEPSVHEETIKKGTDISSVPRIHVLAERTGLEPATSGVTGRHSNRLNYHSNNICVVGDTGFEPVTLGL